MVCSCCVQSNISSFSNYQKNVFWHGTTVGWLMKDGFKIGLDGFGETLSPQPFIWLHASKGSAIIQAKFSYHGYFNRQQNNHPNPFSGKCCPAGRYLYRVEICGNAKILNFWEKKLSSSVALQVLNSIASSKKKLELGSLGICFVRKLNHDCLVKNFFIKCWDLIFGGEGCVLSRLINDDYFWFKFLCSELGLDHCDANVRWQRLELFCKEADIDVVKNPKARFHGNGERVHDDDDSCAEWAIMNLIRGGSPTYIITDVFVV